MGIRVFLMPKSTIFEFSAHNLTVMLIMITHHDQVKDIREKLPPDILALQLQQLINPVPPPLFLGETRIVHKCSRGIRAVSSLSEYNLIPEDHLLKDLGYTEH
ncbi:hypothetical protein PIB30_027950 [Stylosanthes scabra]|uniref:Uncharacterized protein n=1 Tax=Stylosanthes scabra TaxID=79078 RepID=A0ABU6SB12_9FABA|nr:hypothetical protein [Stylosanthes scabra]